MKNSENEYCWVEECNNDCGETNCNVFRTSDSQIDYTTGAYVWSTEECTVPETTVSEHGANLAGGFEDTFMTAFTEFCPSGNCV